MIALLVVIWLLWRLLLDETKLLDTKKVHLGETFSKIQLDVCACMYVNTSKALEIERQNTVIKRNFSFNLDIEV